MSATADLGMLQTLSASFPFFEQYKPDAVL